MPDLLKRLSLCLLALCIGCDDKPDSPSPGDASAPDALMMDAGASDTGASDVGPDSDMTVASDSEPAADGGSTDADVADGATSPDMAGTVDASPVNDAFALPDGALDFGTPDAQPQAENNAPLDPSPPGGAQMNAQHLEAMAADGAFLHFSPERLTPRIDELGDTSDFQPWFVYRATVDTPWRWLIMAIYLPDGTAARVPADARRLLVGRTSPWRAGAGAEEVPVGQGANALEGPDLCGRAKMGARFELVLPSGERIANVVGLVSVVSPQAQFDMEWLRGCEPGIVP